jgi:hypothetical protein
MSDNVALAWNQVALEAVRQTRTGPPIGARAWTMAGLLFAGRRPQDGPA